ncbi:MAG TPA: hypothetical protein VFP55_13650 [Solirubrobacteraceae bacterium]|nr:hypothetical protein [Solirubrobacteraceae bacterium]
MPLILGFAELLGAVLLLSKAITNASFAQIVKGQAAQVYKTNQAAAAAGGASPSGQADAAQVNAATLGPGGQTNPVPGASTAGGRLDQGVDLTSKTFLAPFDGIVKYATSSDPGWKGGGYVAIANALNPKQVVYFAEGLAPFVMTGDHVTAGQVIARPAMNPYNGLLGNIETGPANPANPRQPLAQVISNPAAEVDRFYQWLRGLGLPAVASTASAGHA